MLALRPLMMDDIPITVATPITTPRIVRKDRNLFARNESSASSRISLIAQSHNRIEIRGFRCRIDPEEQADSRRNRQTQRNRPPFDRCRQGREVRNSECYGRAQQYAENPADQGERRSLDTD